MTSTATLHDQTETDISMFMAQTHHFAQLVAGGPEGYSEQAEGVFRELMRALGVMNRRIVQLEAEVERMQRAESERANEHR